MLQRRVIAVEGVVQGVGFRPYVHGLAAARDLRGSVRNGPGGVVIDIEGSALEVDDFLRALPIAPPPLASISRIGVVAAEPQS